MFQEEEARFRWSESRSYGKVAIFIMNATDDGSRNIPVLKVW